MEKIKPSIRKGVWVDKEGKVAVLNGVAQKEIKADEQLFWYGECYVFKGKLICIVNNDIQTKLKKEEPFMNQDERITILKSIKYIDEVFLSIDKDKSVSKSLEFIKPHIFAKGGDRYSSEIPESEICKKLNISIIDGLGDKIQSSSTLIKKSKDL